MGNLWLSKTVKLSTAFTEAARKNNFIFIFLNFNKNSENLYQEKIIKWLFSCTKSKVNRFQRASRFEFDAYRSRNIYWRSTVGSSSLSIQIMTVKSLMEDVYLRKRLRKSYKVDFGRSVPRKMVRKWFHSKWFLKLFNLSYSDWIFIYWFRKS